MEDHQNYPQQYWHCLIRAKYSDGYICEEYLNDLTLDSLRQKVLLPYQRQEKLFINGRIVQNADDITVLKIRHTTKTIAQLSELFPHRVGNNAKQAPFTLESESTNHDDLVADTVQLDTPLERVLVICSRLQYAAQALVDRREKHTELPMSDEYDVQDLLVAVLRASFRLTIEEQFLEKLANAKSGKVDVVLKDYGIVVEIKFARESKDQSKFAKAFAEDVQLYAKWPQLKHLIFLVYNADLLKDSEALAIEFAKPRTIGDLGFQTHVVYPGPLDGRRFG
jgi:hypothetical protein